MKTKNEANIILVLEGLKQFMELFSGPFLITYFIKLSSDSAVTISFYQIISSLSIAVGCYFVGRIIRNKFKLGMYRLSIFMNLIYIVCFIVLSDRVLDFIPLIAAMYGLSAACYWYPINLLKSTKISDEERPKFFARDRITVTAVAVIGPIILGTMITKLDYHQTAYVIAVISLVQLGVSFLLKPVAPTDNPPFRMKEAIKCFMKDDRFKIMMQAHFCVGLNINGGALGSIAMIAMMGVLKTDQKVGYATSIANLLVIIGVAFFTRRYRNRDPKYFVYACGIIPAFIYLLQFVTDIGIFAVLFYVTYYSFSCMLMPIQDVYLYSVLARNNIGECYREEFFSVSEVVLGAGRVFSYILLLLAGLTRSDAVMNLITWILVISVFMNAWFINHFEKY